MFISPVQLTTSRIGNLTRFVHTLLIGLTIHTYTHAAHIYPYCTVSDTFYIAHAHFILVVGMEKERRA